MRDVYVDSIVDDGWLLARLLFVLWMAMLVLALREEDGRGSDSVFLSLDIPMPGGE